MNDHDPGYPFTRSSAVPTTHAALLAAGGRYAELFELQAAGYR